MDNNAEEAVQAPVQKSSSIGTWFSGFLCLCLVGLGGGGYYVHMQSQEELGLLHDYVMKVETELQTKNEAVITLKNNLAKISADSQSQDQILSDHLRALDDELKRVSKRMNKLAVVSSQSWLLAEVEYLLKISDYRILSKQDVKGAVQLLKAADDLIENMPSSDQGLLDVRVAISRDIASLESYRNVDVPGTYAALVTLGESIEKLPLIITEPGAEPVEGEKAVEQPKMLSAINETMAGYLAIRKHDVSELKMLLSAEQRINLRDSIRLTLEQAQTALLRGDQQVYDQSLGKVRAWVHAHFVSDHFRVQMAIKKVESLIKVEVEHDLPSIANSQQELKRYISDRMRASF